MIITSNSITNLFTVHPTQTRLFKRTDTDFGRNSPSSGYCDRNV